MAEVTFFEQLQPYLPYISSVVCSLIAGFGSYCKARKDSKEDMAKLEKQHELDIDKERQMFAMEKEKLELEHKHQMEILQKQLENSMGTTFITEAMKLEEVRQQISQGMRNGAKKKRN